MMRDEDLLVGFTEEEKRALQEIRQLAEEGNIVGAVRKASETFEDGQGIGVALRVSIITPAVRKGQPFEEVCEAVREAVATLEDHSKRNLFETALQEYQRMVKELKQAVRSVAGIWSDHPEFEGLEVREWRWRLWDSRRRKDGA